MLEMSVPIGSEEKMRKKSKIKEKGIRPIPEIKVIKRGTIVQTTTRIETKITTKRIIAIEEEQEIKRSLDETARNIENAKFIDKDTAIKMLWG